MASGNPRMLFGTLAFILIVLYGRALYVLSMSSLVRDLFGIPSCLGFGLEDCPRLSYGGFRHLFISMVCARS